MTAAGPQLSSTDDCHMEALIFHAKLGRIVEQISREVYTIKVVPDDVRLAASYRLGADLRRWRSSLPPFLGSINPNSLILSFRRQATMLKISYCHAVMLAHRPFLLRSSTADDPNTLELKKTCLNECIAAAQSILETVDRMAREGRLFHAFWWTHYVCFCALVVVYIWTIQESNDSTTLHERRTILDQAERCLQHLAQATASNSPSRRYSIILQELRAEATRKTTVPVQDPLSSTTSGSAAHLDHGVNLHPDVVAPHEHEAPQMWQPLFGSLINAANPGSQHFLDDWQTTDWLQLDSSAFGPFPEMDNGSQMWIDHVT